MLKLFTRQQQETQVISSPVVIRAALFMILSAFCFSVVELTGEHLVTGISPFQLVWMRYAVHLLFMMVVLGPRYKTTLVRTPHLPLQIVRSLTMLAMPVSFVIAATHMPINDVWSLQWLSPLMMLGLSTWVLSEPATAKNWVITGLGFGAMLLILRVDSGIISPYSIFAVITGFSLSLHLMLSRVLRDDHPLTSLFHTALWVFIVLGFVVPFLWTTPTLSSLVGIVIIGVVGALGLFALARSGELAPLTAVAVFAYTEALWTILLNAQLFGIMPGKAELLGGMIILGITVYQLISHHRQPVKV